MELVRDNNTYKDSDIFGKVEPDNRPHTTKVVFLVCS